MGQFCSSHDWRLVIAKEVHSFPVVSYPVTFVPGKEFLAIFYRGGFRRSCALALPAWPWAGQKQGRCFFDGRLSSDRSLLPGHSGVGSLPFRAAT